MIIFDGRLEFFRYPQGAVRENHKIALNIYIRRNFPCSPKVIIEKRVNYDKIFYKSVPMEWKSTEKNYDLYSCEFIVEQSGHYFYSFGFNREINPYAETHELLVYDEGYKTPDWIKGGIIYHIFVDRFYREKINYKKDDMVIRDDWGGTPCYMPDKNGKIKNNDFFGGNIEGIILKLDYLKSLGVTAVYLSPVFEAHSNHKYDVGDYFKTDPMFGNENSLKKLCIEAEKYGMNIILDLVLSHTGDDSIYFNKYGKYNSVGAYQSKNSPYYDWYTFYNWNDDYNCWWNIKILPSINKDNIIFKNFIMGPSGVLNHYLNMGVMGYRLDVADELPNEFLNELRISVKSCNNDALIIGEVWEDAANKYAYDKLKKYFCGNQLDSVTNYPVRTAIIEYVKKKDCHMLYETMNTIMEKYPPQSSNCLMNILGTHDTERILTVLGSDSVPETKHEMASFKLSGKEFSNGICMLKVAALIQMTLPGVPCIYYGDESGIEGWVDPFNRGCFPWGHENREILEHYKFLSVLRKSSSLFVEGKYKCLVHDAGVFVYERYDHVRRIIIAINLCDKAISLNFNNKLTEYRSKKETGEFLVESEKFLILSDDIENKNNH